MGQRDIMSYKTSVRRKNGIESASPMCRLDVESAVKGSGAGDVLHSSRYMLGRGVKRKLSECEDPGPPLPYPQQRQHVLDLCLDKLQSCHRRAEPSLHRSVLLANTLRQIQQEMRQEGGPHPPPAQPPAPSLPHAATPRHHPDLPSSDSAAAALPPWSSLLCEEEDTQDPPTARPDREGGPHPSSEEGGRSPDLLFGSFEITNSTSYLTDLQLDDIFDDIDTSMYDATDFSVLACPASSRGGGASVLAGEENLKAFSNCSSTSSTLQLCLTDLNDLDHIMEILVRS